MRYEEAIAKHEPLSEFENGLVSGLLAYSWMKDGQTFVGTGSRLLGDAIDRMITESRARRDPVAAPGRSLTDVLHEVKDELLCYSVQVFYGQQEAGLDDTGQTEDERQIAIYADPAGFLGGLRIVLQGTLSELLALDLFGEYEPIANPPKEALLERPYHLRTGRFVYGSEDAVRDWPAKVAKRRERKDSDDG